MAGKQIIPSNAYLLKMLLSQNQRGYYISVASHRLYSRDGTILLSRGLPTLAPTLRYFYKITEAPQVTITTYRY